jgi:hypothetical protein
VAQGRRAAREDGGGGEQRTGVKIWRFDDGRRERTAVLIQKFDLSPKKAEGRILMRDVLYLRRVAHLHARPALPTARRAL